MVSKHQRSYRSHCDLSPLPLSDCHGRICLYNGELDLKTCECTCPSHTTGKSCENLDCSSLPNDCPISSTHGDVCKLYINVPLECPKYCGLCDRYDAVLAHYGSTSPVSSTNRSSFPLSIILQFLSVVVCGLLFSKE